MVKTQVTELGLEKQCSKCGDYYPADNEFFYSNRTNSDGLDCYCKACRQEIRVKYQPNKTTILKPREPIDILR